MRSQRARNHLYKYTHVRPYPFDHLQKTEPTYLDIDEVIMNALLLMDTSSATKK